MLKEAVIQAPILHYLDPTKGFIVYTDTSDNACGAQLSQEHDRMVYTEYIMQLQNGTITSRELKSLHEMTTNHWQDLLMERMQQ